MKLALVRIEDDLPAGFAALRAAAVSEGFGFLNRLGDRWRRGAYDGNAASLMAVYAEGELGAIGAQTSDEYDPDPGHRRIRHFYVRPDLRRAGIGRRLAGALEADAFSLATRLHPARTKRCACELLG
jgi:GNAT superfamily N-acetyltransferase